MDAPTEPSPLAGDRGRPRDAAWPLKSRGGLVRVWHATRHSWQGLVAAWRHESAFRQELAVGIPLLVLVPFVAPGRWAGLAMALAVLAVFVVELLNSAIEAVADRVSIERNPLIKRAKDFGSAAVLLTLAGAAATWAVALWPAG